MPVTVAQIAANTAKTSFVVKLETEDGRVLEETVNLTYYPGRVTEKAISSMQVFTAMSASTTPDEAEDAFASFNEMLANLLKSWDVLDADGTTMFPIDAARFAELPFNFRMSVFTAIMEDIRPESPAPTSQTPTQN